MANEQALTADQTAQLQALDGRAPDTQDIPEAPEANWQHARRGALPVENTGLLAPERFSATADDFVHYGPAVTEDLTTPAQREINRFHDEQMKLIMANLREAAAREELEAAPPVNSANHSEHSTLRERIVEHVFVGDALRTLWRQGVTDVEVLRSEFDAHGYDLVMSRGPIVRHIQFKTGVRPKPSRVSISAALASKPSGCVIWIQVTRGLDLGPFWWLGGHPGEPLPSLDSYKVAQRIGRRADGERPLRQGHRHVPGSAFKLLPNIPAVLEALFGPIKMLPLSL